MWIHNETHFYAIRVHTLLCLMFVALPNACTSHPTYKLDGWIKLENALSNYNCKHKDCCSYLRCKSIGSEATIA